MVNIIDAMHLNYDHIIISYAIPSDFSSTFSVQQSIIPERLNQMCIVAHHWNEGILSFLMVCHSTRYVTCIKFKGSSYDRSLSCERKSSVGINTISLISIDRSTLS